MYRAEFGDGSTTLKQLLIRFPVWIDDTTPNGKAWQARLREAAHLLTMTADVDFTLRIVVSAERIERQIFLNALNGDSEILETLARALLRLDDAAQGLVQVCADRAEYDAQQATLPAQALIVAVDPMRHDTQVLLHDFRLIGAFDALGATALASKRSVCWQGAFHAYSPSPEARRTVQRNRLALDAAAGIPARLRDYEDSVAMRFEHAAFLLDECLWLDSELVTPARRYVDAAWREGPGALGLPACTLDALSDDTVEIVRSALHPALFMERHVLDAALAATTRADAVAMAAWEPPKSWRTGNVINGAAAPEAAEAYLQRIESRLAALEQKLAQRSVRADECAELRKAVGIGQQDTAFALVKARQILERIVSRLYRLHRPTVQGKALLFDMIRDLTGQANRPAVLPRRIGHYLDTIRVLGNLEAHATSDAPDTATPANALSRDDVELSLLMMVNVIEWYLLDHEPPVA